MAQTYSDLYNLQIAGIRFFTVYGPYGRPDMAIYKFTENILKVRKLMFLIMVIIIEILPT